MGGALDPTTATARRLVRAALDDLDAGAQVAIAVSGGADSLALAAATAFVAREAALDARAVIVDHQLQDGSDKVALQAADAVESLGIPATVLAVDVGTAGGPEAAARSARYEALGAIGADAVLLGHTLDDQAETVLLGLGRGSGARSLAGMAARDGLWRRPFLALRRADTETICQAAGLAWWSDPHNADPSFRRVRVRTEVMPLLEDVLGGGVAEALGRTASQLRQDSSHLDDLAAHCADACDVGLLEQAAPAIRMRLLRRAALEAGADASALTARHLSELERLITHWHGQQRVELPGGVCASRSGTSLIFANTPVGA